MVHFAQVRISGRKLLASIHFAGSSIIMPNQYLHRIVNSGARKALWDYSPLPHVHMHTGCSLNRDSRHKYQSLQALLFCQATTSSLPNTWRLQINFLFIVSDLMDNRIGSFRIKKPSLLPKTTIPLCRLLLLSWQSQTSLVQPTTFNIEHSCNPLLENSLITILPS